MATNPNPALAFSTDDNVDNEPMLTREEWWTLMESLFGSAKEMYASVGGSDAFMREERAAWDEHDELMDRL